MDKLNLLPEKQRQQAVGFIDNAETFEGIWIASPYFVPDGQVLSKKVEDMLNEDFSRSRTVELTDYTQRSFFFKLAVRSARLLAPIL